MVDLPIPGLMSIRLSVGDSVDVKGRYTKYLLREPTGSVERQKHKK